MPIIFRFRSLLWGTVQNRTVCTRERSDFCTFWAKNLTWQTAEYQPISAARKKRVDNFLLDFNLGAMKDHFLLQFYVKTAQSLALEADAWHSMPWASLAVLPVTHQTVLVEYQKAWREQTKAEYVRLVMAGICDEYGRDNVIFTNYLPQLPDDVQPNLETTSND